MLFLLRFFGELHDPMGFSPLGPLNASGPVVSTSAAKLADRKTRRAFARMKQTPQRLQGEPPRGKMDLPSLEVQDT